MTKGTASMGKRNSRAHTRCRRCGRHSYHVSRGQCASCGFGKYAKLRNYAWAKHHPKPRKPK